MNKHTERRNSARTTRKTAARRITGRIIESRPTRPGIYARVRAFNGGNLRRTIVWQGRRVVSRLDLMVSTLAHIYSRLYCRRGATLARIYLRMSNGVVFNGIRSKFAPLAWERERGKKRRRKKRKKGEKEREKKGGERKKRGGEEKKRRSTGHSTYLFMGTKIYTRARTYERARRAVNSQQK